MATTRIIPMHKNKGKTIAKCLSDRTSYALDPEKTNNGALVSSYQCNPSIVDSEFLFSKKRYVSQTGREQKNDVIAYQVRQSFKPGEITPEEANRLGYEFAMRFLKGKHAFIVATHIDKKHIHNHIIWNSTSLDCQRKFRNFYNSTVAVRQLSDTICLQHGLSVIENPRPHGKTYDAWLGEKKKVSHREKLRMAIDEAIAKKPKTFDDLLRLLLDDGYEVKRRGKDISIRGPGEKGYLRLSSLKPPYTEELLTAVLAGEQKHTPRKRKTISASPTEPSLLVDIDAKLREGKGQGYRRWAGNFNMKQMAQTLSYLTEHKLLAYSDLVVALENSEKHFFDLSQKIKDADSRMDEISALKKHIVNYAKTRDVYVAYRKAGYSKKFRSEHAEEIQLHQDAKRAFDELGLKKLPSVRSLQAEYTELLTEKKRMYAEYKKSRNDMRELLIHKANVETLLGIDHPEKRDRERKPER